MKRDKCCWSNPADRDGTGGRREVSQLLEPEVAPRPNAGRPRNLVLGPCPLLLLLICGDQTTDIARQGVEGRAILGIGAEAMALDECGARKNPDIYPALKLGWEEPQQVGCRSEVKKHRHLAHRPFPQQQAVIKAQEPDGSVRANGPAVVPCLLELLEVALAPRAIHDPDEPTVERVARLTFFRSDGRVLKLDDPAPFSANIGNVPGAVGGTVEVLLPVFREVILPGAVPLGFVFPPRIAVATDLVGPVPDAGFAALCEYRIAAPGTIAGVVGLGLLAASFDESEFHCAMIRHPRSRHASRLTDDSRIPALDQAVGSGMSARFTRGPGTAEAANAPVRRTSNSSTRRSHSRS